MVAVGVLLAIYAIMSIATYLVYWHDKRKAEEVARLGLVGFAAGRRRVAERKMHTLELLGGWPGGLVAQRKLWHKVHSLKYQIPYWFVVGLHVGAGWWIVVGGHGPAFDHAVRAALGFAVSLAGN